MKPNQMDKQEGVQIKKRKRQSIYEVYIEFLLLRGAELNIPFETTKATMLNTIDKYSNRYYHKKLFNKVDTELLKTSELYKTSRR
jgi:hypothetical protein